MGTKHTDGPWEIDPKGSITARINGCNRAVAYVYPTGIGDERAHYDRRLIAAAPELLEALNLAEGFMAGFEGDELQDGIDEKLATIRAAIAKATGEATQ